MDFRAQIMKAGVNRKFGISTRVFCMSERSHAGGISLCLRETHVGRQEQSIRMKLTSSSSVLFAHTAKKPLFSNASM